MSIVGGNDVGGWVGSGWVRRWLVGEHRGWVGGWVKSGMSDDGRSDAGGWVRRWPVGGAPWVGGWSRMVGEGGVEGLLQNP